MLNEKCYFSKDVTNKISCSKDGEFNFYGFELNVCEHYPCKKIININKNKR